MGMIDRDDQPTGPGVLTNIATVEPDGEEMVNRWYDEEHVPDRLRITGFNAVTRYRSVGEEVLRHMTVWEVDDVTWPFSAEYKAIPLDRWTDRIGHLRGSSHRTGWVELPIGCPSVSAVEHEPGVLPGIRVITMEIPPVHIDDFTAWYDEEHIPELLNGGVFRSVRRFRAYASNLFMAVFEVGDALYHSRPEYRPPTPSEWTKRVGGYRLNVERTSWATIVADTAQTGA